MQFGQCLLTRIAWFVGTFFTQEDGYLLESGKNPGRIVIACGIAVFVIGTVAPVMTLVFDGPVSPIGAKQHGRVLFTVG